MEYEKLLEKINEWEKNRDLAKTRGDNRKVRKYQNQINAAKLKKIEMEREIPDDVIGTLEDRIKSLEEQNKSYVEKNQELQEKIDKLNLRIDKMVHPEAYEEKVPDLTIPTLFECPNCHRTYPEEDMADHQQNCIKSQAQQ